MRASRKRTLFTLLFIVTVIFLVSALVLYALRQNISLFYTPSQIAEGDAPLQHKIRIGGMVKKGSIIRSRKGLEVEFDLTDFNQVVHVKFNGILPDLFREGQGVVAQGVLQDDTHFKAVQILAKHDENYMPPEVRSSLKNKDVS